MRRVLTGKRILLIAAGLLGVLSVGLYVGPYNILGKIPFVKFGEVADSASKSPGESRLVLEMDIDGYTTKILEDRPKYTVRTAMRSARVYPGVTVTGNAIRFRIQDNAKAALVRGYIREKSPELEIEDKGDGNYEARINRAALRTRISAVMDQSIKLIRSRIDDIDFDEADVRHLGNNRILVFVRGGLDVHGLKALIDGLARVTIHSVDRRCAPDKPPPSGSVILPFNRRDTVGNARKYCFYKRIVASAGQFADIQMQFLNRRPVIAFRLDTKNRRTIFRRISIPRGINRPIVIVQNNTIIATARLGISPISVSGFIVGDFTEQEAEKLVSLLRHAKLPARVSYVDEREIPSP